MNNVDAWRAMFDGKTIENRRGDRYKVKENCLYGKMHDECLYWVSGGIFLSNEYSPFSVVDETIFEKPEDALNHLRGGRNARVEAPGEEDVVINGSPLPAEALLVKVAFQNNWPVRKA